MEKIQILNQSDSTPQRDRELDLVDILCQKNKVSVDIGASKGKYTEALLPVSSHVFAYEPLAEFAHNLAIDFKGAPLTVRAYALSNVEESAMLHTPEYIDPREQRKTVYGWSSIVKDFSDLQGQRPDKFPSVQIRSVPTKTLDSEDIKSVGFIKVDVEGAEIEVLEGAKDTIEREHPVLLIEIEERHRANSIQQVTSYLKELGYQGYFIYEKDMVPIERFSVETMQALRKLPGEATPANTLYINNFIFIPTEKTEILGSLQERLREIA